MVKKEKDGRGAAAIAYQKQRSADIRAKIVAFFKADPFATKKECALAIGVSVHTVYMHTKALRKQRKSHNKT